MDAIIIFWDQVAGIIGATLLAQCMACVCAAVLAAGVGRRAASLRHACWRLALLALWLVPPMVFAAWVLAPEVERSATRAAAVPTASVTDAAASQPSGPAAAPVPDRPAPESAYARTPGATPGPAPVITADRMAWLIDLCWDAVYAWAAGTLTGLAALCYQLAAGWWLCRTSEPAAGPAGPRVRVSERIATPCVVGVLRPTVLLPVGFESDSAGGRAVIAHELAHATRGDPRVMFLAGLTRALLWWHPLTWVIDRLLRITAEEACDDAALAVVNEPQSYAARLLEEAKRAPCLCGAAITSGGRHLLRRVRRVLDGRPGPVRGIPLWGKWSGGLGLPAVAIACVVLMGILPGDPTAGPPPLLQDDFHGCVLLVGTDQAAGLADTIVLAFVDTRTRRVALLSVPRDLAVYSPDVGRCRANSVMNLARARSQGLEDGIPALSEALEQSLGVRPDAYAIVDTGAFPGLVDALGGVEVTVPDGPLGNGLHYDDWEQGLHIHLEPGKRLLNGEEAEGFVRWRKTNAALGDGDQARAGRQRDLLIALAGRVAARLADERVDAPSAAQILAAGWRAKIRTSLSLGQMVAVATSLPTAGREAIRDEAVPLAGSGLDSALGHYVIANELATRALTAELGSWVGGSAGGGELSPASPEVAALVRKLERPSARSDPSTARALAAIGPDAAAALPALEERALCADGVVVADYVAAIIAIAGDDAPGRLRHLIKVSDRDAVRVIAGQALAESGETHGVFEVFLSALACPDAFARERAKEGLIELNDPRTREAVTEQAETWSPPGDTPWPTPEMVEVMGRFGESQ